MEQLAIKPTFVITTIAIALLIVLVVSQFQIDPLGSLENQSSADVPLANTVPENLDNQTNAASTTEPIVNDTAPSKPPQPKKNEATNNFATSYSTPIITQQPYVEPTEPPKPPRPTLNESFLLTAMKNLGVNGGQIVLENDFAILDRDVLVTSNITLVGANPDITIYLVGKRIGVSPNATAVTFKDFTVDTSEIGDRYASVIRENSSNVLYDNVRFRNYVGNAGVIYVMGRNVSLNNLSFVGVGMKPILISGSNVSVKNCYSNDNSRSALITVMGGLSDITVTGNTALNRPMLTASYGNTSKNIRIENNTFLFPNGTYGILIMGGTTDYIPSPHENVTVSGNIITAAPGAWNAIAIYGLTRNALVANNTVDMSLSGHNGISISSGVNVTVSGNIVYGSTEATEGGIEVESNPAHNRNVGFSENVTVTGNIVYNSAWGIYVRVMQPYHPNWNGTILLSKNIVIDNNTVYDCKIGVNLLQGEAITVTNNNIASNTTPFSVDQTRVFNYTVTGNIGYS